MVRNVCGVWALGWADLPVLDTSYPAPIDRWCRAFEIKLKAGRLESETVVLSACVKFPRPSAESCEILELGSGWLYDENGIF